MFLCLPRLASAAFLVPFLAHASPQTPSPSPIATGSPASVPQTTTVVLEGIVLDENGAPADGALVLSSGGGRAVTGFDGWYRLDLEVPFEAGGLQVTAFSGTSSCSTASTSVILAAYPGPVRVIPLVLSPGSSCPPRWLPKFGATQGVLGMVLAWAVFDDGSGPALYAAGDIPQAGGLPVNDIARWDGTRWWALGSGVNGPVDALTVFDDGSGPALYVGGSFTLAGGAVANRIAKWDGASWSSLGIGMDARVRALTVFDDGAQSVLCAGGDFTSAGGVAANRIAIWEGSQWAPLGNGFTRGASATVRALTTFDDGNGPALYAGGTFTWSGPTMLNGIARWDGTSWSALSGGVSGWVNALEVFDDGSGAALVVGGNFVSAGSVSANRVARWDGSWSALGSGFDGPSFPVTPEVHSLAAFDDGAGPKLYAGGTFTTSGSLTVDRIATWDGTSWSALGGGADCCVMSLFVWDDGSEPELYAGGGFRTFAGVQASGVARRDGAGWSALGSGIEGGVVSLASWDDGSGSALYVAGAFLEIGTLHVGGIAKWNGSSWSALSSGMSGGEGVYSLQVFDDGSGPALYAGGTFTTAGGVPANNIARWDGSNWSSVGNGLNQLVLGLAVFDDGSGPALYSGGLVANSISRWNGSSWSPIGGTFNDGITGLATLDDGNGPALFAWGHFTTVSGMAVNHIARWNGSTWSSLAGGMNHDVQCATVFDDGSGPALFAGGLFTLAGGVSVSKFARWDGTSWSAPAGLTPGQVTGLAVHDDGSGPALYVGGGFTLLGSRNLARWDGSSWSPLGSGVNDSFLTMQSHDDGNGPTLFVGGGFSTAFDSGDSFLAAWGRPSDTLPPMLDCPSIVLVGDRYGSPPGERVTFSVTATDECDPSPTVVCAPPSGSIFPRGTTMVVCTATDQAGHTSTCRFPVTVARGIH